MNRTDLAAALADVEGWLQDDEAFALHALARGTPGDAPVVVEIGSWKGRSTIAMALAFAQRGAGTVVAVDPHAGGYLRTELGEDSWPEFQRNIAEAGMTDHVRPVVATSVEARQRFHEPIDGLFVDGLHRYETVMADIDAWESLLRPGAWVAFHDFGVYRGLTQALNERVLRGAPFRRPKLISSLLIVTYEPGPATRRDAAAAALMRTAVWAKVVVSAAIRAGSHLVRAMPRP